MAAITLNGTELRTSDGRLTTWIRKGLYGPPDYRGDTWVIAGKAGETVVAGSFVRARRMIELGQQIKGIGATEALAQVDFLATVDALKTLYESTMGAPKDLRVYAPLYGIGGSLWSPRPEPRARSRTVRRFRRPTTRATARRRPRRLFRRLTSRSRRPTVQIRSRSAGR